MGKDKPEKSVKQSEPIKRDPLDPGNFDSYAEWDEARKLAEKN
jgi:hypothetical protein